jgi:hypothetical protein
MPDYPSRTSYRRVPLWKKYKDRSYVRSDDEQASDYYFDRNLWAKVQRMMADCLKSGGHVEFTSYDDRFGRLNAIFDLTLYYPNQE